jgi:hypothetical protein
MLYILKQWHGLKLLTFLCSLFVISRGLAQGPSVESDITVAVTTTCEAMVPASCQGAFGFQIFGSGAWRAGPAPDGRASAGRLTELEALAIQIAGAHALQGWELGANECPARPTTPPGVMETVIVANRTHRITLRGVGGKLDPSCGAVSSAASVLFEIADKIMRYSYPRPF